MKRFVDLQVLLLRLNTISNFLKNQGTKKESFKKLSNKTPCKKTIQKSKSLKTFLGFQNPEALLFLC